MNPLSAPGSAVGRGVVRWAALPVLLSTAAASTGCASDASTRASSSEGDTSRDDGATSTSPVGHDDGGSMHAFSAGDPQTLAPPDETSSTSEPACPMSADPFVGCGDGVLANDEECDDGNWTSKDGCSRLCIREPLTLGGGHTCGIQLDGALKCWGNNHDGQLGLGETEDRGDDPGEEIANLPSVQLGSGFGVASVFTGVQHTCALSTGGDVKCWGYNLFGGLGLEDSDYRGDEPGEMGDALPKVNLGKVRPAKLALGFHWTCAHLEDRRVKCWGANGNGFLGLGDTEARGWIPGQMGDALPFVDVGTCERVRNLAVGLEHACVLLESGAVKCWGDNEKGQLGLGDIEPRGDDPGEMGDELPALDLGSSAVVGLTAGGYHTCATFEDRSVKCWGANDGGQLGLGDTNHRGDEPGEMGTALQAVQLPTGERAADAVAGGLSTCVVTEQGHVVCWGNNSVEQLGHDGDNVGDEPEEMGDNLLPVDLGGATATASLVGGVHACAVLTDGSTKCWTSNVLGQLGLGYVEL